MFFSLISMMKSVSSQIFPAAADVLLLLVEGLLKLLSLVPLRLNLLSLIGLRMIYFKNEGLF